MTFTHLTAGLPTTRSDYFQLHPTNQLKAHRCDEQCRPAPYTGPIRLGRRDEEITHGRD